MVDRPASGRLFLSGPAGSGKTTCAIHRALALLDRGVRADSLLILVPQRGLGIPYQRQLARAHRRPGGQVSVVTFGGLARRMVDLFWPLAAEKAGFAHPDRPPVFLTLETAQYHMARLVRPLLLQEGLFEGVVIDRNRLYSQIIDNLSKAAVAGFPHTEIAQRLKAAWIGEPAQARIYDDAQRCAELFRRYCLEHNLLDFSLQVEVFLHHLWPDPMCRSYLETRYRHLIVDNAEEVTPVTHDVLREWVPRFESALLLLDEQGGYRRFLGADPEGAYALRELCDDQIRFDRSLVTTPGLESLAAHIGHALGRAALPSDGTGEGDEEALRASLTFQYHRYYPQMLDWVAEQIAELVHGQGVPPSEIVVLAPFLSDALRFSLMVRLEHHGVPARSHRPSRALRDEPATQCLLTLARLAHPQWKLHPEREDFARALLLAIDEMDLVRARLMAEILFRKVDGVPTLQPFDQIHPEMHERLTHVFGGRYEGLRTWIEDYRQGPEAPLDHFLARLFGEVLSQPGYGFHNDFDAAAIAANLVESARKFRWAVEGLGADAAPESIGREYVQMVEDGVIAAQYLREWESAEEEAVLLAPAYTFLMNNRSVDYQFWLDVGARGWFERLYQPLTHPYVLSRHWPEGRPWTEADEYEAEQESLYRLVTGLIRRCRKGIFLGLSELGERGYEQRGMLLLALDRALRQVSHV